MSLDIDLHDYGAQQRRSTSASSVTVSTSMAVVSSRRFSSQRRPRRVAVFRQLQGLIAVLARGGDSLDRDVPAVIQFDVLLQQGFRARGFGSRASTLARDLSRDHDGVQPDVCADIDEVAAAESSRRISRSSTWSQSPK